MARLVLGSTSDISPMSAAAHHTPRPCFIGAVRPKKLARAAYRHHGGEPMQKEDTHRVAETHHGLSPMLQPNTRDKPRLLILDEDRIILQSLSQFLRREGYEVRTTDRSDDAFSLMEAGQVELLLADVNVPGVKPAEFLRDVRRRFPHVVVVVITSYGSIEGAVEATKTGAFDYLTKPIVDEEIRVVVAKAARQQSLLFENQSLKQQLDLRFGLENVVGHDHKMLKIFDLVEAVADSRTTVLMTGESGTGKSILARAVHHRSPRRVKPSALGSMGAVPD